MLTNHPKVRLVIYILAIASLVASFFVVQFSPELATAFVSTSSVLGSVAGVTAIANWNNRPPPSDLSDVPDF